MKALLQNMDQQHAQILKQLRRGQGDKKNTSKQVKQPVPCKQRPLLVTRSCALHKNRHASWDQRPRVSVCQPQASVS